MSVNFSELRELLLAINQTDISEFTLKSDDFEVVVRKGSSLANHTDVASPAAIAPVSEMSALTSPLMASPLANQKLLEVKSPIVGTFYRAPGPDDPSFVEVGDRIKIGQGICIVEAMKVMNEIEAEVSGEIVEILVQSSQPVEFDQVLMRVKPV